jgi:hypothetical protein
MLRGLPRGFCTSPNKVELCKSPACTRCRIDIEPDLCGGNCTPLDNFTGLIIGASFEGKRDFVEALGEIAVGDRL